MPNEVQTKTGRCSTHGTVEGTREIPRLTFPWIVNLVRRALAGRRKPYVCPTCGEELATG